MIMIRAYGWHTGQMQVAQMPATGAVIGPSGNTHPTMAHWMKTGLMGPWMPGINSAIRESLPP